MNLAQSLALAQPRTPVDALRLARTHVSDRPAALHLIDLAMHLIEHPQPKRSTAEVKRSEILRALADGPLAKREIAQRIDRSLSFTGALLSDLASTGTVRRIGDGYALAEQFSTRHGKA